MAGQERRALLQGVCSRIRSRMVREARCRTTESEEGEGERLMTEHEALVVELHAAVEEIVDATIATASLLEHHARMR